MMTIIMYKVQFQYGVADLFSKKIIDCFKEDGIKVIEVDLSLTTYLQDLINILSEDTVDCVIGFNGLGAEIQLENKSIYDLVQTNFLGLFIDHPAHHMMNLLHPIQHYLTSFIDKAHVDYVNHILPQNHKLNFFLPHGGLGESTSIAQTLEEYKEKKTIDLFFSGTYFGEPQKPWEKIEGFPLNLFDRVCNLLIYDDYISVEGAFNSVLEEEKIKFSTISSAQVSGLLIQIISYIRQYKRHFVLHKLFESGLNITVCGNSWDNIVSKYPNVTYLGAQDITDVMVLNKQSKIVLNVNPNFTQGGHERVFTAMLSGAVVFSDKSRYYDEYYEDKITFLTYSIKTIDTDIEKLKTVLLNDDLLFNISKKAQTITLEHHTWKERTKKLKEMISFSKAMNL